MLGAETNRQDDGSADLLLPFLAPGTHNRCSRKARGTHPHQPDFFCLLPASSVCCFCRAAVKTFLHLILFHRALILSSSSSSSAFLEPRSRNCLELGFLYYLFISVGHWVADLYFTSAICCSSQFRLDSLSGKCHPSIHPSLVWIGLPIRVLAGRSSDSNLSTVAARAELR